MSQLKGRKEAGRLMLGCWEAMMLGRWEAWRPGSWKAFSASKFGDY